MTDAADQKDKLRVLRARMDSAATPAKRLKATLDFAELLSRSDPTAARPFLDQVVTESEQAGQVGDEGRAASILSELLRRAGDLESSARYAELVRKAADATGDRRGRACWLNLVGLIHQERGQLQEAHDCFEESLRVSRETRFVQGEQSALNQLAGVYGLRGEPEKALESYRQCLEADARVGDTFGRALTLHNIGWTLESIGHWAEAFEHLHRAIALCEEHGFHDLLLSSRMQLGELSLKRSDHESAALMFESVIKAERETNSAGQMLREALSNLGWTYFRSGNPARAVQPLGEAARLSEAAEDRCMLATISRRRAELALAQGRLNEAGELLAQAESHATDLNLRKEQGEVLRVKGLLSIAREESDGALEMLSRSEETLQPLGDTFELAQARLQRGRLLLVLGRSKEALPLLRIAARTFHRLAVVAESEEVSRLLYPLDAGSDRDAAIVQGLISVNMLGLAPERGIELVLSILCDGLKFERGAVLVGGRTVALRGQPNLSRMPKRRAAPSQSDLELLLPVKQDRRLLGIVWLERSQPLVADLKADLLGMVSRIVAQSLEKLAELTAIGAGRSQEVPGLRFGGIIGRNPQVLEVLLQVPRAATAAMPVLVEGETGTGKELVARALHESGPRAGQPFITVNCAAVPESLLEAEFFGVEAGATTGVTARPGKFELADGGTIFLDEIGEMSPLLQAKLLRVVEDKKVTRVGGSAEKHVDVWVIAATNMNLDLLRSQGKFREDLLYRLCGFRFELPPLRRRREDIPVLTDYFIARTSQEHNRPARRTSRALMALFAEYPWPGNIRQLQHVVSRAVILATGETIEVSDLPTELREAASSSDTRPSARIQSARRMAGDEAERTVLLDALKRANGKVSQAMKLTGYSRTHFYRLLRKHHIVDRDFSD